jgi:hypothetical protein
MTGPLSPLRGLAERHLGSCRLVALLGGDGPGQRVARFRAADGRQYIAKQMTAHGRATLGQLSGETPDA